MPDVSYIRESAGAVAAPINLVSVEKKAADWIQAVAGGALTVKDGSGTSVSFAALAAGEVLSGPFREITSSAGKVRYGTGTGPRPPTSSTASETNAASSASAAASSASSAATSATAAGTSATAAATSATAAASSASGAAAAGNAYTPATPGDWAGTAPTTKSAAIDRLAALVKTLNSDTGA